MSDLFDPAPADYVVRAENFGVPQARHRVIVCGIRQDVFDRAGGMMHLRPMQPPTVGDVIGDLPVLRPALSYRGGGMHWLKSLDQPLFRETVGELRRSSDPTCRRVASAMERIRAELFGRLDVGPGAERLLMLRPDVGPRTLRGWYRDRPVHIVANHETREHMPDDLVRYLFMACFGREAGASPKLGQFPRCLLPAHRNINTSAMKDVPFKDRFRVQLAERHSMTVTSHICKDGHAFIHPDPMQCRALTVREAARLQTFPDSYVFLGNRTSQFTQVGNAVPPYLAVQIAELVADLLMRAGMADKQACAPSFSQTLRAA
jgi:DNA (cytosine-5)-methyltransferase 1